MFSRRGAVVRSVGAVTFCAEGPEYDSPPASAIWFDVRKGIRSIKCYTAPDKSPLRLRSPSEPRYK